MISLTDYTSCDEIRAMIGVDSLELSDSTIMLPNYTQGLFIKLRGFSGTVEGESGSIISIYEAFLEEAELTENQEYFVSLVRQFATSSIAEACCSGLSMFALKTDTDGKASQSRFASENTYRDVITNIREKLASLTGLLEGRCLVRRSML